MRRTVRSPGAGAALTVRVVAQLGSWLLTCRNVPPSRGAMRRHRFPWTKSRRSTCRGRTGLGPVRWAASLAALVPAELGEVSGAGAATEILASAPGACPGRRRVRDTCGGETKRDRDAFHGASPRQSPGQSAGDLIHALSVDGKPPGPPVVPRRESRVTPVRRDPDSLLGHDRGTKRDAILREWSTRGNALQREAAHPLEPQICVIVHRKAKGTPGDWGWGPGAPGH